jgi:hypothetical protein
LAGAATGAYLGSLPGALDNLSDATNSDRAKRPEKSPNIRKAGMLLAVATPGPVAEATALEVLRSAGATDIERTHGTIDGGEWPGFDPVSPVHYVDGEG